MKTQQTIKPSAVLSPLLVAVALMGIQPRHAAAQNGYKFTPIAFLGDPAPGGGTFNNDPAPPGLNSRGQLAFTAEPVSGEEAIFLLSRGTLTQIVRFGQAAPGGGMFSTAEVGNIGLNESGDAAFAFTLDPLDFGPPVVAGVYRWSHRTQALTPVVVPNLTLAPGGGMFTGVQFNVGLNNRGTVAFSGYVSTPSGPHTGIFVQDRRGEIASIFRPGDPAPDGGTVIDALYPTINEGGDVAFSAHVTTDPTSDTFRVYVWRSATGLLEAIPQPAGVLDTTNPLINNRGDVAFPGSFFPFGVSPLGQGGIYLRSGGRTTTVAVVGNPAPGGGHFSEITAVSSSSQITFNNRGEVAFDAATDTGDEALYLYSRASGALRRVAGIGTVVPGAGTIVSLEQFIGVQPPPPPPTTSFPGSFAALNDRGQVAFAATVTDGIVVRGVLLLATPEDD
jgi:hypothetical protein